MFSGCVFTWVIDELAWGIIADAVLHLVLSKRSAKATTSLPPTSTGVVVDVLEVDLNDKRH